jgi:hypothetical protein
MFHVYNTVVCPQSILCCKENYYFLSSEFESLCYLRTTMVEMMKTEHAPQRAFKSK